ncbi:efflux RND transporter permease subunit [Yunchengibacter salinarum]|uniref:efflux RND transporter permease subunit n=1 Tax=Yunchengibacter salinarum TaxID=3133399 RepID=UPI0035B5E1AA
MINRIIEWFARNTVAANLLMAGIFLSGFLAFNSMERELDPQVHFPGLEITVPWPGAAPQEVEEQIILRIEEAVSDLDNVDWVRSFANEGSGRVLILANNMGIDFGQFMADVQRRIDAISTFPQDIEPPRIVQWVNRNEYIRVAVSGDIGERPLKRLAEDMREEVAALPAISIVQLFGTRDEEVSIEVSEEAMRRYGLTFDEVAQAIRGSSINLSSGTVRTDTGSYSLRARNMADTQQDFSRIVVRQTSDGGTITVGDVATVIDGFVDEPILATLNGEPAVLIQVMTTDTMNIVKASEAVRDWLDKRQETLPEGVSLTLWTDNADIFNSRMETIGGAALQGLFLVTLVLLLTLRPKVAFWVTVGIATAYAGAFIILPMVGVSINMLSTFAFLLVLGIVVDDAIVVGESIHTESHKTGGGLTAAMLGTQLVAKPVIFAVLTTIIAFLPWIWIEGSTSEFTRHITWVVIAALSFSLVESLLILPAHLSHLKPRENLTRFDRFQKRIADGIVTFADTRYRGFGELAVKNRYMTVAIFLFALFLAFALMASGFAKTSFMPEIESDEVYINVTMPDGNPYWRSEDVLAQLQRAQETLVREVAERSGEENTLIENWYTRSRRDSVIAIVKLAPPEVRDMSSKQAALRLRELIGDIPDAKEVTVNYTLNNPDPGFQLSVAHEDLNMLRAAVADLEEKLRSYDATYDVRNNLQGATEEIRFRMKPGTEKLGLDLADVSRQVRQAYYGEEVQRLPRDGSDVKVMVRYPESSRNSVESLKDFRVRTDDGREVPLTAVADLVYEPGIKQIVRRNGKRAAEVSADLTDDVRGDIMTDLRENFFPEWEARYPGLTRDVTGQAEGEQRFLQEVLTLYSTAFFIMYALLAIAFRSYGQPIAILVAIPFAFAGAIYGHFLLGMTMAIFSYFGIAAAAGVVINDNLVLIDFYNRLKERGMGTREAIVEAGVARFRPILLTSVTTFVGLMPMMLEQSTQAAFLKPIVVALAFGVAIALFITLLLVPAIIVIGDDLVHGKQALAGAVKRLVRGRPADQAAE